MSEVKNDVSQEKESPARDSGKPPLSRRWWTGYAVVVLGTALATAIVVALLMNISERKAEASVSFYRVVDVDESITDPEVWAKNWPRQYDTYRRTVDTERTKYGGSEAIPIQKLDKDPWLRLMWSGFAFSIDYREARGHAFMLHDQEVTRRQERPQPGACLHCHASVIPAYRYAGDGDVHAGFLKLNPLPFDEARNITNAAGEKLIEHPISCVDCHAPDTMEVRVTRPAFEIGIAALKKHEEGIENYQVNRDATRQEMRVYVCAQCHVEYYFTPDATTVVYPWSQGTKAEEIEAYYDEIGFSDWTHGVTGGGMIKAQHPEFELWREGAHAQAGVTCVDCHMPYKRDGAMKVTDHHVRSPLLNIARSCQTCHGGTERELMDRALNIQDRTQVLIDRAAVALVDLIENIAVAQESGATQEQLAEAIAMQRKAQWRLDFIYSENSRGFHAAQESARVLAESIDYARRGENLARQLFEQRPEDFQVQPAPIDGVTPADKGPDGPHRTSMR